MKPTTSTITPISMIIAGPVKAPQASVRTLSKRSMMPRGRPTTMPAKISSDMPLPTPRSVICSPSHMMKALPVVRVSMVIRMNEGPGCTTKSPPRCRCQDHGQIAGPLGDLLASEFAFFLQLGQRLIDHGQQLQNDRRSDIGHDAQGKNGQAAELTAGKKIHKAKQASLVLLEELLQLVRIHSRRGNVSAQAVHRQQPKREQDALA